MENLYKITEDHIDNSQKFVCTKNIKTASNF